MSKKTANHSNAKPYSGADKLFMDSCSLASVRATHRQYRKWVNGYGAAFNKKNKAAQSNNG